MGSKDLEGLAIVLVTRVRSADELKEIHRTKDTSNKGYFDKKECDASEELLSYLYAQQTEYGDKYTRGFGPIFHEELVSGVINGKIRAKKADLFIKIYNGWIAVLDYVLTFSGEPVDTRELISALYEMRVQVEDRIGGTVVSRNLTEHAREVLGGQAEPGQDFDKYFVVFLRWPDPDEKEIYGILELDPNYEYISDSLVRDVLSREGSMIRNIRLYYSSEVSLVVFEDEPCRYIRAITNSEYESYLDDAIRAFEKCAPKSRRGCCMLYAMMNYVVEVEPLRIERFLLNNIIERITIEGKGKKEMALLKKELANGIDFYYSLLSATYAGVSRAIVKAREAMGIDELRGFLNIKMGFLSDAVETDHQLQLEKWNKYLTYTIASLGFAPLAFSFVRSYFYLNPLQGVALLLAFTIVFLFLISKLFERFLRSP
ncbi:MAG: hypothetical protein ACP5GH_05085 [Nitrososphaeria archaeon]